MTHAPLMIGVSGLRGVVGASLTPSVAARFAAAFASTLPPRSRVVLARDGRVGGEAFHAAALSGLLASGVDVMDAGVASTPTTAILGEHLKARGGVVITASHNPQEWNGLKLMAASPRLAAPPEAAAREVIARFHADCAPLAPWKNVGRVVPLRVDPVAVHADLIVERLHELDLLKPIRKARFRVVVDSVNASGAAGARALMNALRVDLVPLYAETTGRFPHPPEPLAENLGVLRRRVRSSGADLGLAQDPDADRLALVDHKGRYIGEEYTLALSAWSLLEARPHARERTLVTNLSTSRMVDDLAARHASRVLRAPVGEANVVAVLGPRGFLGGEGNGGVIWPAVTMIRDSLAAAALVLGLLARRDESLADLVASIPSYAIVKRKVPLSRKEDAAEALSALARAHQGSASVDTRDGVRVDWPEAWLHVRPSNTEPILRLIAEAPGRAQAEAILDEAARVVGYTDAR